MGMSETAPATMRLIGPPTAGDSTSCDLLIVLKLQNFSWAREASLVESFRKSLERYFSIQDCRGAGIPGLAEGQRLHITQPLPRLAHTLLQVGVGHLRGC